MLGVHACTHSGLNVFGCTVTEMTKKEFVSCDKSAAGRGFGLGWSAVLTVKEISEMLVGFDTSM